MKADYTITYSPDLSRMYMIVCQTYAQKLSQCRSRAPACSNPVQQSPSMRLFYSILLVSHASSWLFIALLLFSCLTLVMCNDRSQVFRHKITDGFIKPRDLTRLWTLWPFKPSLLFIQICMVFLFPSSLLNMPHWKHSSSTGWWNPEPATSSVAKYSCLINYIKSYKIWKWQNNTHTYTFRWYFVAPPDWMVVLWPLPFPFSLFLNILSQTPYN